ncbi:MAG: divergent polysaccharide deacetylase family protein [Candidatus Omnitrophota bacterium]|nr:divergent polysaccharide deacetylase family protein [Candidatus Omnitrophota bacterium]
MKSKIILIIAAGAGIFLIAAGMFLYWKSAYVPKKRIIVQKRAVLKVPAKKKALPAVQKKFSNPKIAIVMDDFGYNMNNTDNLFAAGQPVTLSILPNLPYSRRVAQLAHSKKYEIILHLPLESNDKSAPKELGTIRTDMDNKKISSILGEDIASVPGLKGISNHQGSKATEDKATMSVILADLKSRNLYFFDSLVTDKSVCMEAAKNAGVPYAKRDMFLDNDSSPDYIEKQVLSLRRLAFRKGSAIGVCHDRKNTVAVLSRMMPELSAEGIEFVPLSEMVR